MRRLTDNQVDAVARELAARLTRSQAAAGVLPQVGGGAPPRDLPAGGYVATTVGVGPVPPPVVQPAGDGVFATVDECVQAATRAFRDLTAGTLAKRMEIITAIRTVMAAEGDRLAEMACR